MAKLTKVIISILLVAMMSAQVFAAFDFQNPWTFAPPAGCTSIDSILPHQFGFITYLFVRASGCPGNQLYLVRFPDTSKSYFYDTFFDNPTFIPITGATPASNNNAVTVGWSNNMDDIVGFFFDFNANTLYVIDLNDDNGNLVG